jgi:phytoene dehydrogenase-like protein
MALSRRSFIKWVLGSGAAMACPFPGAAGEPGGPPKAAPKLGGEANAACHAVRDGKLPAFPAPSKSVDVVVVGAGPSGYAAAEALRGSDYLVLEKEPVVGGNALAERWNGLDYCTGSAWASIFSPEVDALFKRWKLDLKPIKGDDTLCFEGRWLKDFWDGKADSPKIELLPYPDSVKNGVRDWLKGIAAIDLESQKEKLDQTRFSDFFKGAPDILKTYWDAFGPSNWGARTEHTSAYLGLQAARDWPGTESFSFEGGLGMVSKVVWDNTPEADKKRYVFDATVVSVERKGKGAVVTFMKDGKLEVVEAKAVVMASPKYITRRLVRDLPEAQDAAMAAMRYAPYAVINACFTKRVWNLGYDNWPLGTKYFTDFVQADWVTHQENGDPAKPQILTLYAPMDEKERADLLDDEESLIRAEKAVEELDRFIPGCTDHLAEVRMFRRGHAMPMSIPGWYTKLQPAARADHPPVYFAHSDSGGEVSDVAYAALNGIESAKKALKHV